MKLRINKKMLAKTARKHHLKFVILHGSYATKRAREDSDIDIAVLEEKELNLDALLEIENAFGQLLHRNGRRDADIKTLRHADPLFRYEVVRDGKLLFGKPLDYENFKWAVFRAYEDAQTLFELERVMSHKLQKTLNHRVKLKGL